ncbi:MAG: protease inhibitor I42 family protein [Dehalogenimonas sp.]
MPPLDNPSKTIRVEYLYDELAVQKHITYDVVIEKGGSLIVTLGSNPSTGYDWQKAVISNSNISSEYTCQFVAPPSGMVGAAGKQIWTFKMLQSGSTTLSFSYSQPWQGGVQNEWTLALNVTVK